MNDAERFGVYCRMTCLGGSERGTCTCTSPSVCELRNHPRFVKLRHETITRMRRHFVNSASSSEDGSQEEDRSE